MDEVFVEQIIKRKTSASGIAIRVICIALVITGFLSMADAEHI